MKDFLKYFLVSLFGLFMIVSCGSNEEVKPKIKYTKYWIDDDSIVNHLIVYENGGYMHRTNGDLHCAVHYSSDSLRASVLLSGHNDDLFTCKEPAPK